MPDSIIGKVSVGDGATFTPSVSSAGELSWTNNKNLPNPETVDLAQAVIDSGAGLFLPLTGGTVTGSVEVTGGVTANVTGNLTGDVTGNLTGDVTGNLTGDVTGNADTATNATNATKATNDANGNNIANTYLPAVVGAVMAFAGSTSPAGWLLCDGSAVSRTTYANLYAVIGTTYGAGDGSTTFNLPNLIDRFVEGSATAGTVKSAGLPNITGDRYNGWGQDTSAGGLIMYGGDSLEGGALYASANKNVSGARYYGTTANVVDWQAQTISFDASRSNAIYGASNTVQPPSVTMRYIIKY